MRQRYYDSSLGRWLSADPIGFSGGLNLYNYVGQNPINLVDPSGLQPPAALVTDPMGVSHPELGRPGSANYGRLACQVIFGDEKTKDEFIDFTLWTLAAELGLNMMARALTGFTLPRGTGGTINGNRRGGLPGSPRFSPQKQGRHVWGDSNYTGGSYFTCMADAKTAFDAYVQGVATFLGMNRSGNPVFQFNGVTGYNHNPANGYPNQPTNTFFMKGTSSASVVPTNPNWTPPPGTTPGGTP